MNATNRATNAVLEQKKGDDAWEEADILFHAGKFDGAVSRAYYAAFHYAVAALLTKGLEANSHKAMQRLFHLHFIRAGIFSPEVGVLLSHAQKAREEADYYPEISYTQSTAKAVIDEVEQFLAVCRAYSETTC